MDTNTMSSNKRVLLAKYLALISGRFQEFQLKNSLMQKILIDRTNDFIQLLFDY